MGIHSVGFMATRTEICTKTSATMSSIVSNTTQTNISSLNRPTSLFNCIKIWTMIATTIIYAISRTTITARRITITLNTILGLDKVFLLLGSHYVSAAKAIAMPIAGRLNPPCWLIHRLGVFENGPH